MIKSLYTTEIANRYKNLKYWDINVTNLTTTIKPSLPNCTVKLYLNITLDNDVIKDIKYHLSGEIFCFVLCELIIDNILNKSINYATSFVSNIDNNNELNKFLVSINSHKVVRYFLIALDRVSDI